MPINNALLCFKALACRSFRILIPNVVAITFEFLLLS